MISFMETYRWYKLSDTKHVRSWLGMSVARAIISGHEGTFGTADTFSTLIVTVSQRAHVTKLIKLCR
jgi:hypothetical protein